MVYKSIVPNSLCTNPTHTQEEQTKTLHRNYHLTITHISCAHCYISTAGKGTSHAYLDQHRVCKTEKFICARVMLK